MALFYPSKSAYLFFESCAVVRPANSSAGHHTQADLLQGQLDVLTARKDGSLVRIP